MPAIDEEVLHDLMHRATGDLHASPAIAAGIAAGRRRRHLRTRVLAGAATGVAAAAAIAVALTSLGTSAGTTGGTATHPATLPAITLTAAQRTLTNLSKAAAAGHQPAGRYVVMSEAQGRDRRTTIADSKTGDTWTFQAGQGIPTSFPVSRHGLPTQAELAAYPTVLGPLRTFLVAQAKHQLAVGIRAMLAQARRYPERLREIKHSLLLNPKETRNDLIFSQAAYLLWNPVVTPTLRSALFRVLAATPGVVVKAHASDSIGRPAVEISRFDPQANYTEAIFESPDASKVLETVSIHPATPAQNGLPAEAAYSLNDTYLSITRTNTRPTKDPYTR
jgi:hypothetical protein